MGWSSSFTAPTENHALFGILLAGFWWSDVHIGSDILGVGFSSLQSQHLAHVCTISSRVSIFGGGDIVRFCARKTVPKNRQNFGTGGSDMFSPT